MNNTSFLFGAVAFAFLFFITARGDLPAWLGVFGLAGSSPGAPSTPAIPAPPAPPAPP